MSRRKDLAQCIPRPSCRSGARWRGVEGGEMSSMKRIFTLALMAAALGVAANLRSAENLRLNPKLNYSSDSQDGPLIAGDRLEEGAVLGMPNYVLMFGEG